MSTPQPPGEPLRFRGSPLGLATLFPTRAPAAAPPVQPGTQAGVPTAAAALSGDARLAPAAHAGARGARAAAAPELRPVVVRSGPLVQLHLPRDTPPGSYEGTLRLGEEERPVVVEVEPEVFLRLFPERLVLTARPGEQVRADLVLVNLGNVAVDVPRSHAFGVFDEGGVECAVGRAAVAKLRPEQRRAEVLADALADLHGGLVRLNVDGGGDPVQPGESRPLRLALTLPDRLHAGHTYWGTWPLHNLGYYVRITVADTAATRKEAPR